MSYWDALKDMELSVSVSTETWEEITMMREITSESESWCLMQIFLHSSIFVACFCLVEIEWDLDVFDLLKLITQKQIIR